MLELADRFAIHELLTRFAVTLDLGDAAGVAALFTEDGTYHSVRQATGRANVEALFSMLIADRGNPNKMIKNPIHSATSPVIGGDGENATALSNFLLVAVARDAEPVPAGVPFHLRLGFENGQPQLLMAGQYLDTLRKEGGEWFFSYRRALTELPEADVIPAREAGRS